MKKATMQINTATLNEPHSYPTCREGFAISRKLYLELPEPNELDTLGDGDRLIRTLQEEIPSLFPEADPHLPIHLSYYVLKRDYPAFRKENWCISVTIVFTGNAYEIISIESGDTTFSHYGLAVDLGSTTVVMNLLDLNTGEIAQEASAFNQQIAFGEDILTRIFYTQDEAAAAKRDEIQKATIDTFRALMKDLEQMTGVDISTCSCMIIGGNTTMIHFLLSLDAFCVFMAPFAPVIQDPGFIPARELNIPIRGMVYCFPAAANYLGGDIISGILAVNMRNQEETSLYIDIGTNGEMVIGNQEFLVAGAGAAGPALEGGISRYGMRATNGAVDTVKILDGKLHVTTIGGDPVRGICGSGIVDLLSEMLLHGWMDMRGFLQPDKSDRIRYVAGGPVIVYGEADETPDGKIRYFSEQDIAQFLDTKAAASTMVKCLLSEVGFEPSEVDHIYTAGSFGKYLDLESAITIGMYPDVDRDKFICIGNGSLLGALTLLSDRRMLSRMSDILLNMHYLQFATLEDFVVQMQAAKFYPHTDLNAYPTVKAKLIANGILI